MPEGRPVMRAVALLLCLVLVAVACGAPGGAPAGGGTATPDPGGGATPANGQPAIVLRRSGGIAGVRQEWTLAGDGRIVDADGGERRVEAEAVAALVRQAEDAGFLDLQLQVPRNSACRDCFTYRLTVRSGNRSNTVAFEDAQEGVPPAVLDLTAAVLALVEG